MMEARAFLESVAGYTRDSTADASANAPVKIGTIDAAYVSGSGNPKVKFDGESTTSVKAYPYLNSYFPVATDRVVLLPVGNTYVIVGRLDTTNITNLVSRVTAAETKLAGLPVVPQVLTGRCTAALTLTTTPQDVAGCSFTFTTTAPNVRVIMDGIFDLRRTAATAGNLLGQCIVDGTLQLPQAVSTVAIVGAITTVAQYWDVVLGAAGSHTVKLAASSSAAAIGSLNTHTGAKLSVFG
jgi:hypothetical protein